MDEFDYFESSIDKSYPKYGNLIIIAITIIVIIGIYVIYDYISNSSTVTTQCPTCKTCDICPEPVKCSTATKCPPCPEPKECTPFAESPKEESIICSEIDSAVLQNYENQISMLKEELKEKNNNSHDNNFLISYSYYDSNKMQLSFMSNFNFNYIEFTLSGMEFSDILRHDLIEKVNKNENRYSIMFTKMINSVDLDFIILTKGNASMTLISVNDKKSNLNINLKNSNSI